MTASVDWGCALVAREWWGAPVTAVGRVGGSGHHVALFVLPVFWILTFAALPAFAAGSGASDNTAREARPVELPSTKTKGPPAAAAPLPVQNIDGADKIGLTVRSLRFEGNTALSSERLSALAGDIVGRQVTLQDVLAIAKKVTAEYARSGFPISYAYLPPRNLDEKAADVVICITEGYVAEVDILGDVRARTSLLDAAVADITRARPLSSRVLERALLRINDLPGRSAKAYFEAAGGAAGATRLSLVVENKVLENVVSVNNFGSRAVGPLRANISGAFLNALGLDEAISGSFVRTVESNALEFTSAGIAGYPLGPDLKLEVVGTYSNSAPSGDSFSEVGLTSDGVTGALRASSALVQSRSLKVSSMVEFYASSLTTRTSLAPDAPSRESARILRMQADVEASRILGWLSGSAGVGISQGLDAFGAELQETGLSGSNGARLDFSSVFASATVRTAVWGPIGLELGGYGQYAATKVLNSEQCGYGGRSFGRGFDSFEISGDSCAMGSAEIQYSPDVVPSWIDGILLYGFVDAGYAWRRGNAPLNAGLASTGFGMRATLDAGLFGSVEYAEPLTGEVAQEGNDDGRVFFQFGKRF